MPFELVAYIASTVFVAALLMWGRLEWHASILVGLLAPIVGIIVAPITGIIIYACVPILNIVFMRFRLPLQWVDHLFPFLMQTWTILAAYLLARSLRAKKYASGK